MFDTALSALLSAIENPFVASCLMCAVALGLNRAFPAWLVLPAIVAYWADGVAGAALTVLLYAVSYLVARRWKARHPA